jgi:O-antigen/teichoic acid export membrane protein
MSRSRLLSAALWSITGNSTQYAIVFGLLIYLAHVLSPHDFGLMATVSIGLDLGTRIARWGQVELLQQKQYRTDDARNQSLRLSLGIAFICCLTFAALALCAGISPFRHRVDRRSGAKKRIPLQGAGFPQHGIGDHRCGGRDRACP